MTLKYGKLHKVTKSQVLWKTDKCGPSANDGNTSIGYLNPETLVLVTKHGRFRYVQVVQGEMIGFIWCAPDKITESHFEEIRNAEELL